MGVFMKGLKKSVEPPAFMGIGTLAASGALN